jgi:hypothetical protein
MAQGSVSAAFAFGVVKKRISDIRNDDRTYQQYQDFGADR